MGAVADRFSAEDCSLKAFTAGADTLLICRHPEKAFSARDRIYRAIKDGELAPQRVTESLDRIYRLQGQVPPFHECLRSGCCTGLFQALKGQPPITTSFSDKQRMRSDARNERQ